MKIDIIIAGVGGQGILSVAASIGQAAIQSGLFLKQSEVHGMSQRGGDVQSHLRLSDKAIYSDIIPIGKADIIVSIEPMESLRYLPMLSPDGWLITSSTPFINFSDYPPIETILNEVRSIKNHVLINSDDIAKEIGSIKSSNMVILGAASPFLKLSYEQLENAIRFIFGKKGEEVVNLNLKCLAKGREFAQEHAHT